MTAMPKASAPVKQPVVTVIPLGEQVAKVCVLVIWTYCCHTNALDKKNSSKQHKKNTQLLV